jgi:hypothetical protein
MEALPVTDTTCLRYRYATSHKQYILSQVLWCELAAVTWSIGVDFTSQDVEQAPIELFSQTDHFNQVHGDP